MSSSRRVIPLVPSDDPEFGACSAAEPFALVVLGDSMLPEFAEGEVIVIEPEGFARDGSYVLALRGGEYVFRQLVRGEAGWILHPLNPAYADEAIGDLSAVKGVIIQKQAPGGRRSTRKRYIE
ncbi:MAG: S24 family peptidase [Rhodocyclaceae bacterium]